ncbi:YqcC family protein [Vibrio aphrogenes]|uniref:YqcC family protein n=1 Tax=Vibrio aphrogenes TaxID=1891186 RepID=UPI000B3600E0|nr:YqcC family protein [Vibrio aphrogenes]
MSDYTALLDVIEQLEDQLIQLSLWESIPPSEAALQSTQPFAVDTLEPTQWLQWIFIPKMRELIQSESQVPIGFEISPYFEESMASHPHLETILSILQQLDETVR